MIITQFLFESYEQLYKPLSQVDGTKPCLIQVFTNALHPTDALELAQKIQTICPKAKIIGSSVSGVIYEGNQYDNETLVVVEQYDQTVIESYIVALEEKTVETVAGEIHSFIGQVEPALMRLFVGAYYDYAHQLIEEMNTLRPTLKLVGGMSGELHLMPKETPFIFDAQQVIAKGLVFCTLENSELNVYGRINTAHQVVGQLHTITATRDRYILEIEHEPAQQWLQRNFGILNTREFGTWEEIAQNDPLARLQLALQSHSRAIRFIHYDEATSEITQYFSRLPSGSQFHVSYTSPSKCAEESMETCREVAITPIEQLFCYSCLFRKLYLKNCAKWELSPYHENPVNGVFLLGEFGYSEEGNALLNGSSVFSGIAEQEMYLSVDMSRLDALADLRNEDEKLMDFIIRKQREYVSVEQQKMLDEMMSLETKHLTSPYLRIDVGVPVGDLSKYEQDREHLRFNKLCMVRAENADVLISQKGELGYYAHLKALLERMSRTRKESDVVGNVHFYIIKADTILIACNQTVDRYTFVRYIHSLQKRCDHIQRVQMEMPFLVRYALVRNHPFLLERAYAIMEENRQSQHHIITDDKFEGGDLVPTDSKNSDELQCIQLIQYALEHDKVVPYYQGLYNNKTGQVDKYEALMRLVDANGRVYTPGYFIEVSKKYRLYLDLNLKMFQSVLRDFSDVDCCVCINLSVHDIESVRFREEMRKALSTFHKPSNLTFELLEDECIANMSGIKAFITEARSYGVKIAVDDFGSGYSNLLELTKIKPDFIKIDGQIIRNLGGNKENEPILEAIALLGNRLQIELVAEFVETASIQDCVLEHSIFYSQGYHFSKPQPFSVLFSQLRSVQVHQEEAEEAVDVIHQEEKSELLEGNMENEKGILQAIQALSSDLLFQLNLATGQMRHFGTAQKVMGVADVIENFPQSVIDMGMVVEDDVAAVYEAMQLMRQGVEQPGYFRIYGRDGVANWYQMDYKLVLDYRGVPIEVIGKLTDIQQQKDMEARINIDPLTGCLRKDAFEILSAEYMERNPDGLGVLFIFDLDNFKSVNDNLGHQFGDRVLQDVGNKLRTLFRGEDLVGRIGGDEFMVMMVGTDNMEVAKRKAGEILSSLDATYSGAIHTYKVSVSIGMAVFPKNGRNFQTLYDHADMALFEAKNSGKHGYVVYHNALSKGTMENTLPYEVATRSLAQHYDPQVMERAFNLLFETKNFDISIQAVLELIGSRFGVSRCYIVESHPKKLNTYQNTYEWCASGVTAEKNNLQEIPSRIFQDFYDLANDDGVLYCNDLSMLKRRECRELMEAQSIQSFLHAYTVKQKNISYVVGMDDCNTSRVWTPIEVSTIMQVSKIIVQFLSYKKTMLDLEVVANERLLVLDSLNYFAYLIDRNTYELLYFNEYMRKMIPGIKLGQQCYEVMRQAKTPCKNCPLVRMIEEEKTSLRSVFFNANLGGHFLTTSTMQPSFGGRECACITSVSLDDMDDIHVI